MAIDLKLVDRLLADYKKPEDIIGENGLLKQLIKALPERAMQAEMTDHLGYGKHDRLKTGATRSARVDLVKHGSNFKRPNSMLGL